MTRLRLVLVVMLACGGVVWPVSGQVPVHGGSGVYAADLAARRAKTLSRLGTDTVLVLWSAPTRVYASSIDYEFRQESNFLYLSGISEEQTVLVLVPGAATKKEWLFVRQADPVRDLWSGPSMTPSDAAARSGIANVRTQRGTEAFDAFMSALLSGRAGPGLPEDATVEFSGFFEAVRGGRAKLGVLGRFLPQDSDAGVGRDSETAVAWAREMAKRHPGVTPFSAGKILTTARQTKTPYEQAVLTRSVEISAEAHIAGMRATRPGRWEYEVEAAIEYVFQRYGATWGYPSIVGSGPNATVLHYLKAHRQMKAGDLLLVDAAANYQGLTGDITRTYPVTGKFSREQRAIYDVVLAAQDAGIRAARPGVSVDDIVTAVRASFAVGLERLGLVGSDIGPEMATQVGLWFPHGPTHGIGVDVHDPLGALDPGATFVIEPGVYIRPAALQALPPTPESAAFIARISPAVEKYRDIGVRIEDSFLMTASGPVMLSAGVPRDASRIEKLVGRGR